MPAPAKPMLSMAVALLLTGCAGGAEQLQLDITGTLPSLPTLPTLVEAGHPGKPSDVYARVARGMLVCWFAGPASLRRTHVFSGDVPPPDKGEKAEIVVYERDAADNPRGLTAVRISFTPRSEGRTDMVVTTPRFIGAQGIAMQRAIERWAAGDPACPRADNAAWSPDESGTSQNGLPQKGKASKKTERQRKAAPRSKPVGGETPAKGTTPAAKPGPPAAKPRLPAAPVQTPTPGVRA